MMKLNHLLIVSLQALVYEPICNYCFFLPLMISD